MADSCWSPLQLVICSSASQRIPAAASLLLLSTDGTAGNSQYTLDLAVAEVVLAGVAVFVAAGNEDTDACLKSPARSAS